MKTNCFTSSWRQCHGSDA